MGRSMPKGAGTIPAALLAIVLGATALSGASAQDAPPALTEKQNSAAKLAGLAGFVNLACPAIRTDRARFEAAVGAMGVQPADLEQGALRLRAEAYVEAYRKDEAASCARAGELFGTAGRIVPGVFVPR